MTNDEWEVFKKEVKPIKKTGVIRKSSIAKKTFEKKKLLKKKIEEISIL